MAHAPTLSAGPHTTLSAVWARRPEAAADLAARHDATAAKSYAELLSRCDAVAFAVPPAVQARMAPEAAAAGRALLLEKPIADDLAGAEDLVQAIDAAGVPSLVLLTWRYTEAVRGLLAAAPGISPNRADARFVSGALLGGPFATPWRLERGPLLDLGPHVIDLLDALLGPVGEVAASGDRLGTVELALEHDGGRRSTATLCANAPDEQHGAGIVVEGDEGRLEVDCASAVGPSTFATVAAELAATARGEPASGAPDAHRGLHLQRIIHAADLQLG